MEMLNKLETMLAGVYSATPKLSGNAKKTIVNFWPIAAVILGVLQLWSAYTLWHWGRDVNKVIATFNSYFGTSSAVAHNLSVIYWISLIVLAIAGVMLLMAYPGLKARAKSGWNLLFYGALLNVVYGVFSAFNDYGGAGSLVISLVVSAVVLYFLFQIRDQYSGARTSASSS
ncbi:MAG: hypothetical protein Q7R60_03410 [bacterium]|nr:hypothetical protein [bacterium]